MGNAAQDLMKDAKEVNGVKLITKSFDNTSVDELRNLSDDIKAESNNTIMVFAAVNDGKVVFFAGGTGHPYFSTDTGTVLRAIEIEADAILLAKSIDGIYDSDPETNPDAVKYDTISIQDVVDKRLQVVDLTSSIMCMENKMPMVVFGLNEENSIVNTLYGTFHGTYVTVEQK
jgi:uridylate kinase